MKNMGFFFTVTLVSLTLVVLISNCKREEKTFFEVSKDTVSVYGYVKDYAGNPVADAEITILPTGEKIKSEKDGLYRFSIGLGELPADAVITYVVKKEGFVQSTAGISFAEVIGGTNDDVAIQKRAKRQDVVLYPPAEIEVEVVDKDSKPVEGSRVLAFPSPQIALYLGVSMGEAVASITSQTTPVKITDAVPAINFIRLVAFPPKGSEEDYNISSADVDVSQGKAKGKVVLTLRPLEIIYSSVAVGQYISPDANIKLIFSKEITGLNTNLICGVNPINITTEIKGAEVEINPAGRILGNCQLTVNGAFGKNGETISGTAIYSFVAYDPNAPRNLACPTIPPFLGSATAVSFDAPRNVILYNPDPSEFNGFTKSTGTQLTFVWDPPVIRGIKKFKIKYIKGSEKDKGTEIWKDTGVTPNFLPSLNKWRVSIDLSTIGTDISYGEKYYFAAIPVNLNDEELCNPETIENPFTVQDNTPPEITNCNLVSGSFSYISGNRTIQIPFSETLTYATATLTSRNFNILKFNELFDTNTNTLNIDFYAESLSTKIPTDAENADADRLIIILNDEAKKIWVGEQVDVKNQNGTDTASSLQVTAIVGGIQNSEVWFSSIVTGSSTYDFRNGFIVPDSSNGLKTLPNGSLYVSNASGKELTVSSATGLTIGDKIQVVDQYTDKRKTLTITSVNSNTNTITVSEDIPDLECKGTTKLCIFRSFNPDIKIKAQGYDTSGNIISTLADQCSNGSGGLIIW